METLENQLIQLNVTLEMDSGNNGVVITNRTYYFAHHDYTEPQGDWREILKFYKATKKISNLRMVTFDLIGMNTETRKEWNIKSSRLIPNGDGLFRQAFLENDKFDLYKNEAFETTPELFIQHTGINFDQRAMFEYIKLIKNEAPCMGEFDAEG